MSEDNLHQQIGKLIAHIDSLKEQDNKIDDRLKQIEKQLSCVDRKVTQHRTGWQTFIWLGWLVVGSVGVAVAIIQG